jgi:eukaryotic-like serine/threonine-protein kinase
MPPGRFGPSDPTSLTGAAAPSDRPEPVAPASKSAAAGVPVGRHQPSRANRGTTFGSVHAPGTEKAPNPDFVDTEAARPLDSEPGQSDPGRPAAAHATTQNEAAIKAPLGRIGPYELRATLPHQGLGRVYRAWDSNEQVDVMLTLLDLADDARERQAVVSRLQQSVLRAAALRHPGLARIHDAGEVEQGVYIVNKWVQGRLLGSAQRVAWQVTARAAACLVRDLAQALAFAHAHGVSHGGLNPSTVMLVAADRAVVLGLGYAGPAYASDLPSMDPLVHGVAPYLAPEQLQGGTIDERTDVHALGVLLYELLAGHRAYPGETVPEVARALMTHDPAPPHWLRQDVPERLSAIAMQALQRNPAARYAQVGEVAAALQAWLQQSDDEASDAMVEPEPAQRRANPRTRTMLMASGALLTTAALAAVGLLFVDSRETRVDRPRGNAAVPGAGSAGSAESGTLAGVAADPGSGVTKGVVSGVVNHGLPLAGPAPQLARRDAGQTPATAAAPVGVAPDGVVPLSPTRVAANPRAVKPAARPPALGQPAAVQAASTKQVVARNAETRRAPTTAVPAPPPNSALANRDNSRPARAIARGNSSAAAHTGTVRLAVSPWGHVEVDGRPAGVTPPLQQLTLPVGRHTITIRNADFAPFAATIQVSADRAAVVRHRFLQ